MFAVTTVCINLHNSANSGRATCKQSIYKRQQLVALASCCILWQLLTCRQDYQAVLLWFRLMPGLWLLVVTVVFLSCPPAVQSKVSYSNMIIAMKWYTESGLRLKSLTHVCMSGYLSLQKVNLTYVYIIILYFICTSCLVVYPI